MEGRLPARSEQARRQSGLYDGQTHQTVTNCAQDRERYSTCEALPLAEGQSGFVLSFKFWNPSQREGESLFPLTHITVNHPVWAGDLRQRQLPQPGRASLHGGGADQGSRLVAIVALCLPLLSSPDGSYTEEQSQESEHKVLATDFDDEFDDEEPLPAIGTCKALYTFEGTAR